jgi:hypothetical protein
MCPSSFPAGVSEHGKRSLADLLAGIRACEEQDFSATAEHPYLFDTAFPRISIKPKPLSG